MKVHKFLKTEKGQKFVEFLLTKGLEDYERLPPRYKTIIIYRLFSFLKYEEIALQMGVSRERIGQVFRSGMRRCITWVRQRRIFPTGYFDEIDDPYINPKY